MSCMVESVTVYRRIVSAPLLTEIASRVDSPVTAVVSNAMEPESMSVGRRVRATSIPKRSTTREVSPN